MDRTLPLSDGEVSCVWHPADADTCVALTHGAGGTLDDPVLVGVCDALASHGVAALRFNLPYRDAGRKLPGSPKPDEACWRDVVAGLSADFARVFCGGKSYGGRIASHVAADGTPMSGLVLLSYPLHPPGKPDRLRDAHLDEIDVPMLFVQGTKDPFARPDLLERTVARLPDATLLSVEGGNHSLRVRGREPLGEIADAVIVFVRKGRVG